MANFMTGIIALTVSIVVVTTVLIPTIKDTNTTSWTASEVAMWSLAGLGIVIGIVYGILNVFGVA